MAELYPTLSPPAPLSLLPSSLSAEEGSLWRGFPLFRPRYEEKRERGQGGESTAFADIRYDVVNTAKEMIEPSDDQLLTLSHRGDSRAFGRLCERHRARLWRTVASATDNAAEADDLAQEALVRAWRALPTFRGDAAFGSWLCRIALNAAHDWRKSAWKRRVLSWTAHAAEDGPEKIDDAPLPDETALLRERQRRIRGAVADLKEKERVPIWLIYFEEHSLAEVARLEGVPESTVRSRVKVGLQRLQDRLGDLAAEGGEPEPTDLDAHGAPPRNFWKECVQP